MRSFFADFSIFRFFVYLFNGSFIPSRSKVFRDYIIKNSKKWRRNKNNSKDPNNNYVLITTILHHQGYVTSEIVIGKNLMEIFNAGGIAILEHYDLKRILLYLMQQKSRRSPKELKMTKKYIKNNIHRIGLLKIVSLDKNF